MAGDFQNSHPNPFIQSAPGFFGSKFVTICVTGNEMNQVDTTGYQVKKLLWWLLSWRTVALLRYEFYDFMKNLVGTVENTRYEEPFSIESLKESACSHNVLTFF